MEEGLFKYWTFARCVVGQFEPYHMAQARCALFVWLLSSVCMLCSCKIHSFLANHKPRGRTDQKEVNVTQEVRAIEIAEQNVYIKHEKTRACRPPMPTYRIWLEYWLLVENQSQSMCCKYKALSVSWYLYSCKAATIGGLRAKSICTARPFVRECANIYELCFSHGKVISSS